MRSSKEDPTLSKPSESSSDMNLEQATTICTNSTEMFPLMELLASCIQKWQVIIVHLLTLSPLSEQQSLTRRKRSEDQEVFNSGTVKLGSLSSGLLPEPVISDTELSLRLTDQTPSGNDPHI
jgi:hypothetical protein